jgi:hypothetical protein
LKKLVVRPYLFFILKTGINLQKSEIFVLKIEVVGKNLVHQLLKKKVLDRWFMLELFEKKQ